MPGEPTGVSRPMRRQGQLLLGVSLALVASCGGQSRNFGSGQAGAGGNSGSDAGGTSSSAPRGDAGDPSEPPMTPPAGRPQGPTRPAPARSLARATAAQEAARPAAARRYGWQAAAVRCGTSDRPQQLRGVRQRLLCAAGLAPRACDICANGCAVLTAPLTKAKPSSAFYIYPSDYFTTTNEMTMTVFVVQGATVFIRFAIDYEEGGRPR